MTRPQEVVVGGVRLAYEVQGRPDRPKMVFLHALGERASSWAPIRDRFAPSFEVFTLDLRGHGDSDRPGSYSFEAMCSDVISLLEQLCRGTDPSH